MNPRVRLVIDELARHRWQFEHLCRSLSSEELAAPIPGSHWTVHHYIAHLATIDGLIAPGFARQTGITVPPPEVPIPQPFDIDEWNHAAVDARESRSIEELLAEAAVHRAHMLLGIERMTDEDLDRIIPYGGDRKSLGLQPMPTRFGGILWGIAIHDPTHTADILKALPQRGSEAWIVEWLGSVNNSIIPDEVRRQRA